MKVGGLPGRKRGDPGHIGLPAVTHLNALILSLLGSGWVDGPRLRENLAAHDVSMTGPGFSTLMKRMKRDSLVWSDFRMVTSGHARVSVSHYKVTPRGRMALDQVKAWYEDLREISR